MFIQFKKINNESGIVLFMVLMAAIIIMIFAVGMLTQSMNEVNYAQQQIDQIAAEELSKGIFWNAYAPNSPLLNTTTVLVSQNEENEDGSSRNYQISMAPGSTVNAITSYNVIVSYNTIQ